MAKDIIMVAILLIVLVGFPAVMAYAFWTAYVRDR